MIVSALLLGSLVGFSPAMAQSKMVKMTTAKAVGSPITLMVNHTYNGVTVDWGDGNPVVYNTKKDVLRVVEGTVKGAVITVTGDRAWDMLSCANCELTEIDLTKATDLHSLYCQNNQLSTIDLRGLSELTDLDCSDNKITSFGLTTEGYIEYDLKKIENINVSNNQLKGTFAVRSASVRLIDAGNNSFDKFYVSSNPELTTLKCGGNQISTLGLTSNRKLSTLVCDNNRLTALTFPSTGVPELQQIVCDGNKLTRLNLSASENLSDLSCKDNQIEQLVRPDNVLDVMDISFNRLTLKDLPRTTKKPTYVQFSPQSALEMQNMPGIVLRDGVPCMNVCESYADRNKEEYALDMSQYRYIGVTSSSTGQIGKVTFQWYSMDGDVQTPMTLTKNGTDGDYSNTSGKFAFYKPQRKAYLRMDCKDYDAFIVTNPIVIGTDITGVNNVITDKDFVISVLSGSITMSSSVEKAVRIYTVDGKTVWNGTVGSTDVTVSLPKGVYVVNGKKVVL